MQGGSYCIEDIPLKYISQGKSTSCILAVCLAKNNPLLGTQISVIHDILQELSNRHEKVYILVADAINVYERLISNGTTFSQAVRLADNEGERIASLYTAYSTELGLNNIEIVRWKEIQNEEHQKRLLQLNKLVLEHKVIKELLEKTAQFYIQRRNPLVTINATRIEYFQKYLLEEMVVQLHGLHGHNILYHTVYINRLEEASLYQSPVLDLKTAFKRDYISNAAFTSRIFIEKPSLEEEEEKNDGTKQ